MSVLVTGPSGGRTQKNQSLPCPISQISSRKLLLYWEGGSEQEVKDDKKLLSQNSSP